MHEQLTQILAPYHGQRGTLVPILQKVQEAVGYLSGEAISEVALFLRLSESEVYGVATFYAQFRFERQGEHRLRVCEGTACHVKGGQHILDEVERALGIRSGETTEDYKFTLERVACLGCCALAPVLVIDNNVHGKINTAKVRQVLAMYQQESKDSK